MSTTWSNWSGAVTSHPSRFVQPTTEAEVIQLVKETADSAGRLKAVGAAHSFTPVAQTDGTLVNLDKMSGLVAFDKEKMTVTLRAGTRLRDCPAILRPLGVAFANQGDVDPQSIIGAISTGTHGTGVGFTGFAGMVRSFRIVTPDGEVHACHPDAPNPLDRELFDLCRISLGAYGIITEVEMDVVPTFVLEAKEAAEPLTPVIEHFPERAHAVDHLEYFWFPRTDVAHVKTNTRRPGDTPTRPIPRWKVAIDDDLLGGIAFGFMNKLSGVLPRLTGPMLQLSAQGLAQREYSDLAHDVFVTPRRVKFNEMEYSVPLADATEVLKDVHRTINRMDEQVLFPIEVRATGADDVPLSTAKGRESCYIALHRYHKQDQWAYFRRIEPIFKAAGGRPHWGKMHSLNHEDLLERHEDLARAAELRGKIDPLGVFRNAMVDRIFGLV
ncbi:FAD-binding protein [Corynebacterium sp. 4HC-13]|uniref:D-arabinono-1,4-lactone oxidase n=1 Tax=Corynebacterium anserum TaxID=2684406 RepID=UPI00163A53CA|nr:D-arabinono-1,4-lactone oxidase [Corynebacterium anserum]MBC2680894.1 FAD-binding protein [Corynebacterium anserum]